MSRQREKQAVTAAAVASEDDSSAPEGFGD